MDKDVKGLTVLRRRCASHLRSLDLPVPFNLEAFCRSLAERRHRPIVLRAIDVPSGLGGVWVASSQTDYILYQARTSSLHRLHIILHELSHLICEHKPIPVNDEEFLQLLLPDLSPRVFRHVLKRAVYSTAEDQEAEMLATLLSARITHYPVEPGLSDDPESREVSRRLVRSLEHEGVRER